MYQLDGHDVQLVNRDAIVWSAPDRDCVSTATSNGELEIVSLWSSGVKVSSIRELANMVNGERCYSTDPADYLPTTIYVRECERLYLARLLLHEEDALLELHVVLTEESGRALGVQGLAQCSARCPWPAQG